ncbi:MAG: YdcF family protein, partial [Clostridia bacterium]|nr:YdcF family protein [Clostridia bacterium]
EGAEQPAEEPPKVNITELNEEIREMVSRNHFGGKDDGFSSGTFDKIIPAVHEAGKTVIVVSCQLPYDATRFPDADAVLLTWWGSAMREMPAEGSTWSVNLPAGLLACFGACPAEGASPVELPALDDQYRPAAKHSEGDDEVIRSQIERAVVSYAANGTRDEEALSALASLNPSLGEKWMRIMDLWETPVTVNEALPDGLPDDDSLCLVGLGFQLNPDGTMREELVERLKVMLAASEKYPNAVIVCTGGGTAADDQTATEAGRMAEWLEANGVNPSRLIVEDHSLTTAQNAIYTFNILSERYPQVKQIAMISSDYHIATGTLLFGAEAILRGSAIEVVSNASWHAPGGTLSVLFQAGALIELSGDVETAFEIYYETYDIHELPPLHQETAAES